MKPTLKPTPNLCTPLTRLTIWNPNCLTRPCSTHVPTGLYRFAPSERRTSQARRELAGPASPRHYRGWNQSQGTIEHIPGVGNQSLGTREHIPGVGTNHRGLESIFRGLEPITGDLRAYSGRWNQSQGTIEHILGGTREHIPGVVALLCKSPAPPLPPIPALRYVCSDHVIIVEGLYKRGKWAGLHWPKAHCKDGHA
eukprot:2405710-Pyramimonas_sp.AAC.1